MLKDNAPPLTTQGDLLTTLEATPDWNNLTAYEMTKRCCIELTKRGRRVPSWVSIRNIIGKGSANDINRGKEDFRHEHGEVLRKMGDVKGVPDALAPHVISLWMTAVDLVRKEFDEQVAEWQVQIAQAEAARDQALEQESALRCVIKTLQEQLAARAGHSDRS